MSIAKRGVRSRTVRLFTIVTFIVSLCTLILFIQSSSTSGDLGIALWAIFLFTFMFVSVPLHFILGIFAVVQLAAGRTKSIMTLYLFLPISVIVHLGIAVKYGAFESSSADFDALSETDALMLKALTRGNDIDVDALQEGLEKGANANGGLNQERVPFIVQVASFANTEGLTLLLEAGADPNARTSIEYSPRFRVDLSQASALDVVGFSEYGDIRQSIQILLDAGADPAGTKIMLGACRKGDLDLYQYAIELGATGEKDANGKNCLHHATEQQQLEFIQSLFSESNLATDTLYSQLVSANNSNQFPLDLAIRSKKYRIAKLFVELGASNNQSWTIRRVLDDPAPNRDKEELAELIKQKGLD